MWEKLVDPRRIELLTSSLRRVRQFVQSMTCDAATMAKLAEKACG